MEILGNGHKPETIDVFVPVTRIVKSARSKNKGLWDRERFLSAMSSVEKSE
jgi:hypothetical protein